jgi:hypothetical protein
VPDAAQGAVRASCAGLKGAMFFPGNKLTPGSSILNQSTTLVHLGSSKPGRPSGALSGGESVGYARPLRGALRLTGPQPRGDLPKGGYFGTPLAGICSGDTIVQGAKTGYLPAARLAPCT